MPDDESRDQVFLVRLWHAKQSADKRAWRGSIQHIASGRRLYVTGIADVVEFITNKLAESQPADTRGLTRGPDMETQVMKSRLPPRNRDLHR